MTALLSGTAEPTVTGARAAQLSSSFSAPASIARPIARPIASISARCRQFGGHIGQHVPHCLEGAYRLPELAPFHGVANRVLQCDPR
jgi:hypothetical protein